MPRIFIDTSIQIQRILGTLDAVQAIENHLTQDNITAITCEYVLMEYQRSLVADFVHVQQQFSTASNFREALVQVTSGRYAFKDQVRVERLLTTVIDNPQAVLGQASCWPLGDIIIALQVPSGRGYGRSILILRHSPRR